MAKRTEPWADVDSGNRFHEPNNETSDDDPDRHYEKEQEYEIEKQLRDE